MTVTRPVVAPAARRPDLSLARLYALRSGYLFMGLGLAVTRWPLLRHASDRPLYQGVTICMLSAMSLLAFLGLRYPVRMLPVLLFESAWKLGWLALVALPRAMGGGALDPATGRTATSCALVVVVLLVIPWPYVWRTYVRGEGDPWR
jgi:hypothetical protein